MVRVARRDDPAAPVVDPLGVLPRPLPTAILVTILAFPIAANLDTGNINLLLALSLFGGPIRRAAAGRADLGPRDVDEVGAGGALDRAPARGRAGGA